MSCIKMRASTRLQRLAALPTTTPESAGLCALEASQSNTLLGIQQSIMLGELAVNRVLDNLDPR